MAVTIAVVDEAPLVVAGLLAVLEPFHDRVRVLTDGPGEPAQGEADMLLRDGLVNPAPCGPPVITCARRVVFSWIDDPVRIRQALADGADGYLSKTLTAAELVEAVERIHGGERVVRGPGGDLDLEAAENRWAGAEHGLSRRESQILSLVCQGLSNTEIAGTAFLSINTVKTYIRSCYRRIGATTRSRAVIWGLQHGFTSEPNTRPAPGPGRSRSRVPVAGRPQVSASSRIGAAGGASVQSLSV